MIRKLISLNFSHLGVSKLAEKANIIVGQLEDHSTVFADPGPVLAVVKAAITDLEAAVAAAAGGDRFAIAVRNQKRQALETHLRNLGLYVDMVACGNRTLAALSGFGQVKEPKRSAPITSVAKPVVSMGPNAAELEAAIKKVRGARAYLFCISPDNQLPLVQWDSYPVTKSRYCFTGLQSAKRYFISVAAVGINNQVVYSDVVSFVTQ